jgi:hypothetical protein
VRYAVAVNSATPPSLIWHLIQDENPDVRFALAENPRLRMEHLIQLTDDDNPYVAARAELTVEAWLRELIHRLLGQKPAGRDHRAIA